MRSKPTILGVSQQRVNQIRAEGKLAHAETAGIGRTRILYRCSDVERPRVKQSIGFLRGLVLRLSD